MKPILAALLAAFFTSANAETVDQLVYDNPEYSIVLNVMPCKIDKKHHPLGMDFAYEATAYDKTSLGHACMLIDFNDGEIYIEVKEQQ
jgi:hypothetical protein